MKDNSKNSPLLSRVQALVPEGIHQTLSSDPVIPAIAARAKRIVQESPGFIRSDQGQIIGILPDKEIYYGPSSGLEELRELVGQFWTYAYNLKGKPGIPPHGLDKNNVAIVSGATEGLSIVMHLIASGQNVGLMPLYWSNYKGIIRNAGGNPVVIELFNEDYQIDFEQTKRTIVDKNITSILVNFPNNPSGDILTEEELNKLTALAEETDLIIVSDEVYNFIRYKGTPQSMLGFAPERTVVVSSASKEYLIPGARVGYVIAAEKTFTSDWMPKMIRSFSSSPNILGQQLLISLLEGEVEDFKNGNLPRLITEIKKELKTRCELILSVLGEKGFFLAGRDKDFPSGAISVLVRLPEDIKIDDVAFIQKALELHKFSAVPGSVFGAPRCIRFGYAGMTQETIKRFSQNLQDVLDHLRT
jgi:aspartate/methionine/tyrosine aminotransferase